MDQSKLSPLAETLISAFEKSTLPHGEGRVRVNVLDFVLIYGKMSLYGE